jgi:hypothetical protein
VALDAREAIKRCLERACGELGLPVEAGVKLKPIIVVEGRHINLLTE